MARFGGFEAEAEEFRFALVQRLNTLHAEEVAYADDVYVKPQDGPPTRQRIWREHFGAIPSFTPTRPNVSTSLKPHLSSLWAIATWGVLLTLGAVLGLRRSAP